ncbi:hypothetical protein RDWZM_003170 [Blomia tropicalis]|uniref:Uncharacterized protein n=1 Tax=Blomia tropicalis TaxID=40697 RepID=A0A9Q0MEY4_BLOTA|nr:hypothetical protein BLOT_000747 [Blomia tropicalis]KAJ6224625.1 hypothetical protein RDWZM_003170 [Blomia tropicalis]
MDYKEIRQTIEDIIVKLENQTLNIKDEKQKSKMLSDASSKLLSQLNSDERAIEKLYLCYLIIEFFNRPNLNKKLSSDFIRSIFPSMLNKRQAALVSQLISLALNLHHGPLLDCLEFYIRNCDAIMFPDIPISSSLATDSPLFCSAVISRGYYRCHPDSSKHLAEWLRTLVDLVPENTIQLTKVIPYSFLERPVDYELHLAILNVIRSRRCEKVSNHLFIINLLYSIQAMPDNHLLVDRLAQMLTIAFANDMCSNSNQLKSVLMTSFSKNILINAICK